MGLSQSRSEKASRALVSAAAQGNLRAVEALLKVPGVDVNFRLTDDLDFTALVNASHRGHVSVVRALLQHPQIEVNKVVDGGITALRCAHYRNRVEVVRLLLSRADIDVNAGFFPVRPLNVTSRQYECTKLILARPELNVNDDTCSKSYTGVGGLHDPLMRGDLARDWPFVPNFRLLLRRDDFKFPSIFDSRGCQGVVLVWLAVAWHEHKQRTAKRHTHARGGAGARGEGPHHRGRRRVWLRRRR